MSSVFSIEIFSSQAGVATAFSEHKELYLFSHKGVPRDTMGVSKRLRSSRAQYPHRPLFIVKGTRISKRAALENNWKYTQFFFREDTCMGLVAPLSVLPFTTVQSARKSPSRFLRAFIVSGLNTRTPERAQAPKLIGRSGRHQLKNLVRLGGCEKRGALAVGIRSSNPGKRQASLMVTSGPVRTVGAHNPKVAGSV